MLCYVVYAAVSTSEGPYEADFVVLAAGLGIPGLAEKLGSKVPLADQPATLTVLTQPMPRLLHHIIVTGGSGRSCHMFLHSEL